MKRSLIFIAMMLVAFTAYAQDKKDQDPKEKFFQARVKEMVYRLNITDEQKPEFVNVYRAYSEAMREAMGPMPKRDGMKKGEKPQAKADKAKPERKKITKEEAVKMEKAKVERQMKAQEVKLQYIDEFAKVLEPEQLVRFFNVEQQIQQKLHSRQQGRPGMKGGRPNGQRPGKGQRPAPRGPRPADEPQQTAE